MGQRSQCGPHIVAVAADFNAQGTLPGGGQHGRGLKNLADAFTQAQALEPGSGQHEGQYDAIILAAAGLTRLGLASRIRSTLPSEVSLPAAGQGALGIEALSDRPEVAAWIAPLADPASAACVRAERATSRALAGSCEVPLGAYAEVQGGELWLRGFVALPDGSRIARAERRGPIDQPEALGLALAEMLRADGADEILASL